MFYCDPIASWQKGKLEKNHEYIRKVIPKGKSLVDYTQDDMTLLMNHINSTARASLKGRNPYELARLQLKKELFKVIGAKKVAADKTLRAREPIYFKSIYSVLSGAWHKTKYSTMGCPYDNAPMERYYNT